MKKSLFGFLLATMLVLTGFAAAHAQDAPPTPADEPSLRMPRYVTPAYTTLGTRNADGTPGPNYWQNHSVHDIAIEVAPPGRTVTGTQTITYTNNSPNPLPLVVVRLIQNSRLPEAVREENHTPDFLTDGIQIDEFSVNGQVMPWATFDASCPLKRSPLPSSGTTISASNTTGKACSIPPLSSSAISFRAFLPTVTPMPACWPVGI
ncbi:MAG: hypothetical protein IPK16_16590 [Anaerolineales bacterium]|nr:hypothetical protein [Anaerolineales bacterium]